MAVDRKQVEAVALTVEMHPNGMHWTMPAEVLAELCKAWLALDAAPEWYVEYRSSSTIELGKEDGGGQRVRLVATSGSE